MSYEEFMEAVANDVTNELVKVAPVDSGSLRTMIKCVVNGDVIDIIMPEYAIYLEYGTGIYVEPGKGPGVPITPKNAKALHWIDHKGEHFAKSVKGMHAQPFIRNTFYHKIKGIVNKNADRYLGTEMEVSYS